MRVRYLVGLIAASLLLFASFELFHATSSPAVSDHVRHYPTAKALPAFQMTDHNGAPFTNEQLQGHWSIMLIGYTFCPDVCPTTLAMLSGVHTDIEHSIGQPLQVVFISADPERDTQERLNLYINYFSERFTAIFGPQERLYPLASSLGLVYGRYEREHSDYYLVDHSASIVLVNPQAKIEAVFRPQPNNIGIYTVSRDTLMHDLPLIIAAHSR